uniref:ribosomal protein S6 kinase alpha-6-like n=1 Tax=Semicossyphus pulcher TaxID=241346 RepID=UPI0037E84BF6
MRPVEETAPLVLTEIYPERGRGPVRLALQGPERQEPQKIQSTPGKGREPLEAKYEQLSPLGEGGFGSVYAGVRRADNFPVAIKHIPRNRVTGVTLQRKTLPLEVGIMLKISSGAAEGKSRSISLLDYYFLDQELILVLERPVPVVDLFDHNVNRGGSLQEEEASDIMRQLVEAARELQTNNVFHRDIKLENILIDTSAEAPQAKLIDFGLSCFANKNSTFKVFRGTLEHIPPECYQRRTCRAGPTTVWQLGVVLYEVLHRCGFETQDFLDGELDISDKLSESCQDVLHLCLHEDPQQRPSLEQLQLHPCGGNSTTGSDRNLPGKRKRTCETGSAGARKTRASEDPEHTRKRQRTSDPELSVDNSRLKRKLSEQEATPRKRQRVSSDAVDKASRREFEAKYEQLSPLGEGGFGSVYAGVRRADNFPVAIKHIPRNRVTGVTLQRKTLPLEVGIMLKISSGAAEGKSRSISLLDYYFLDQELILVLERPVPVVDLFDHNVNRGGSLQEEEASDIMRQLVEAARELQTNNVFHRDIKLENILIDTSAEAPQAKLIDFGLSCFANKNSTFKVFRGTLEHIPPECYQRRTCRAGPTTVWQLGVVLYEVLHRCGFETQDFLDGELDISDKLSESCQDVLHLCLHEDPQQRPSLEQLQLHPWLT